MIISQWRKNENIIEAFMSLKEGFSPFLMLRCIPNDTNNGWGVSVRDCRTGKLLASTPSGGFPFENEEKAKKDAIKKSFIVIKLELDEIKQL